MLPPFSKGILTEFGPPVEAGESLESELATLEGNVDTQQYRQFILRYLPNSKPSGYTPDFECLYQFDGTVDDLDDRTTNGNDLVIQGAVAHMKTVSASGLIGWSFIPNDNIYARGPNGNYQNTGAGTIEVTGCWATPFGTVCHIFNIGYDGSALESRNQVMGLRVTATTAEIAGWHESGGGNDINAGIGCCVPRYADGYFALTRAADGVTYKFYFNGNLYGTAVAASAPTGGTDGYIYVGGQSSSTDYSGNIMSARYSKGEMTAAQIAEVNEYLRAGW